MGTPKQRSKVAIFVISKALREYIFLSLRGQAIYEIYCVENGSRQDTCRGSVPSIAVGETTEVDVWAVGSGRQQVSFSSLKITWFQREKKKKDLSIKRMCGIKYGLKQNVK